MRFGARLSSLVVCFLLMLGGASAYRVTLSADVSAWPGIAESSLQALNAWLLGAELELDLDDGRGMAVLRTGDKPLFTMLTRDGSLTIDIPGALPATRFLLGDRPADALLPGLPADVPDIPRAWQAAKEAAGVFLPLLEPYGKPVRGGVSIRNAGTAKSRVEYALKPQEAQAVWDAALPRLPAIFTRLTGLAFTRAVSVKRYLDAQGADMGLQITGTAILNGVERRVTIYGGVSSKGGYASLRFPAVKGGDTLEIQVSLTFARDRLKGDWRLKSRESGATIEASGRVDLKITQEEGGKRLTGSVTARVRTKDTVDWALKPDLLLREGAAQGGIRFTQKKGGKVAREFGVQMTAASAVFPDEPAALAPVDASLMNGTDLAHLRLNIAAALTQPIRAFLLTLPLPQRLALLHDMGRTRRTEGDAVPALSAETFTVSDEPGILP